MAGVSIPVTSPDPYANDEDLAAFWRALNGDEFTRANSLLTLASNRLRTIADNVSINLDEKVNASESYFKTVQWVVMEATKRAMLTPTDAPPATETSMTAGPYSENIKYANPAGDLWFKNTELKDLGLAGIQKLSAFSTSQRDIYSDYESS